MELFSNHCPDCDSDQIKIHTRYQTQHHGERHIYRCQACDAYFSDTVATPIAGLRTPLSRVVQILQARSDGMGLNAAARTFHVSKKSIIDWEWRLSDLKPTLLLYSLLHQFLSQVVEGDELYTKVGKNTIAADSEGWTIVLMERGSRFLWELHCGRKDQQLFEAALSILASVIEQTADLTLLSDGERRYGNILFSICHQLLHSGSPGRPRKTLPKGVRVRLKNKGSKKRRGRPRPKYQAPVPEHPQTPSEMAQPTIHANHVEAFNAALRRRNSAFRRKTNTYAKTRPDLQRTLNRDWLIHNFVRDHFTTKQVPAVALGILENGLSWSQLFNLRCVC
jgi:transposase-like protein